MSPSYATYATFIPPQVIQQAGMIAWADVLGAITAEALAEREKLSIDVARKCLDEAVELGFLDRHSVLVGHSDLYAATAAGRQLAHKHADAGGYSCPQGMRKARVSIKQARHTIARASVVAALERRYPDHRVISERELHREESQRGRRLASVEVRRRGETEAHFPDAVIWPPSSSGEPPPLPIAVEVELTAKWREELTAICRAFARCHRIKAVVYYTDTAKVEENLFDAIEELKAEEMIVVNPLSEIVGPLPGFELSRWEDDD
jgi:hypothetical protein